MDRMGFLAGLGGLGLASLLGATRWGRGPGGPRTGGEHDGPGPHPDWKKLLSPAAYAVLFEEDTERPFTSPLNDEHRAGTFVCAACFQPLFDAHAKFDSGTGWPSFYEPLPGRITTKRDFKLIVPRTEYHCNHCGGHQGHVFDDGPPPTGLRYCNNGLALNFIPKGQALPALRG